VRNAWILGVITLPSATFIAYALLFHFCPTTASVYVLKPLIKSIGADGFHDAWIASLVTAVGGVLVSCFDLKSRVTIVCLVINAGWLGFAGFLYVWMATHPVRGVFQTFAYMTS
jgi:hypothetical protein